MCLTRLMQLACMQHIALTLRQFWKKKKKKKEGEGEMYSI